MPRPSGVTRPPSNAPSSSSAWPWYLPSNISTSGVGVPVDVSEGPAALALDDDRRVLVEDRHPRHRHAVRHARPRPLEPPRPAGPELGKAPKLALAQALEPRPWDLAYLHLARRPTDEAQRRGLGD